MNQKYKVGIYLRLSKEDEKDKESGSITNQRSILMNYIKENNLTYINEYIDDGVSGTTFDRIGFNQMLQDIQNKKINMVLTKDTSRLGRDHIEFGYYVEKYFPEHNVRYVAVCDNIDTFYNNNDMLLFKSAYNDMYVKDISNKIRASLNIKKKNGEFVGAYAPYGYKKDQLDKHKLVIDTYASEIVKRIYQMFASGLSITKIASILTEEKILIPSIYKNMNRGLKSSLFGTWNQRTITDILTNPTYIGHLTQGRNKKINYKSKKRIHTKPEEWIIKENACPAIIDIPLYNLVQNIYHSNKNRYQQKKTKKELLLKGLVFCEECGHTIGFRSVYQTTKNGTVERIYGNCNYFLKHRTKKACTDHSVKYEILEPIILKEVKKNYQQLEKKDLMEFLNKILTKQQMLNSSKKEFLNLEKEIIFLEQKIDKLYDDRLNEIITKERYLKVFQKLTEEQERKQEKLTRLKQKLNNQKPVNYQQMITDIIELKNIDRSLISNLITKITINTSNEIKIYYKFKNVTFESISCNPILK